MLQSSETVYVRLSMNSMQISTIITVISKNL
jgi:hypothetical protein